jgi:hypothetical protein
MRETAKIEPTQHADLGIVPTGYSLSGPKTVPRVDYERVFVLDDRNDLLGEYVLDDDSPLEFADLRRAIPVSGMRHLVSFYLGEYAFTPFRVDELWFVMLTRGIPRIEDRGSIGTLLAAARVHIVPNLAPALAQREADLRTRERNLLDKEAALARKEAHLRQVESELQLEGTRLKERETDVLVREAKVGALREYAIQMQREFHRDRPEDFPVPTEEKAKPRPDVSVVP